MTTGRMWHWEAEFARSVRWLRVRRLFTQIAGQHSGPADESGTTARTIAAFESLMQGRERDVFGYLWRLTGDEQTAYDLCQETFLRAWQRFATVSHYEQPGAWLFRVATNLAINSLKKRRELTYIGDDALGDEMTIASLSATEDPAHQYEVRDLVHRTLLRLQPRHRSALVLREVYGLSSVEVAEALGTSHAAAKMALSRAREEFRRRLAHEEGRS